MRQDSTFDVLSFIFFAIITFLDVYFMSLDVVKLYYVLIAGGLALAYIIFLFVYWFLGRDIDDNKIVAFICVVSFVALISFKYFNLKSYFYAIVGIIICVSSVIIEFNDTFIDGK